MANAPAAPAIATDPIQHFLSWVVDEALPRWAPRDDDAPLPFAERRGFDGERKDPGFIRLRVVARQVAVYAQAAVAGYRGYHAAAERGWQALVRYYWEAGEGWIARVNRRGEPVDREFALYDQASALYACACWARASGSTLAVALAERTLILIDRRLGQSGQPGWRSISDATGRDQNSHMHFLEALLALHRVAPGHAVERGITALLQLAEHQLFDAASGCIMERFDDRWRALPGQAGVEPGHQYEWVWLLASARDRGFASALPAGRLFAFAQRHGWSAATGLIHDHCHADGTPSSRDHRLWPHCEAIRAASVHADRMEGRQLAERAASRLLAIFLTTDFSGGWIDRVDAGYRPIVDHVPASSLYHLWKAAKALVKAGWPVSGRAGPC